jgi:nitrite reductase/ring-hydroxylating ferredoxin subunit
MPHPDARNETHACEGDPIDRRRRDLIATMVLAGGAALLTGTPLGIYAVAPAFGKGIDQWIEMGPVGDLPEDGFEMRPYEFLVKDGWLVLPQRGFVWARVRPGGATQVFSSTCTHLACNVIWQSETGTFECPCHSGRFDAAGRPIAGPPTRPLKELECTVEADTLKVHLTT